MQLKRLDNWHPNVPKKRLIQKPKTNNADGKHSSNTEIGDISGNNVVDSANPDSVDDLLDYYLKNIMIEESLMDSKPSIPADKSHPVFLPLRDTNDLNDSDIKSSYPVNLSPIRASKVNPCPLL